MDVLRCYLRDGRLQGPNTENNRTVMVSDVYNSFFLLNFGGSRNEGRTGCAAKCPDTQRQILNSIFADYSDDWFIPFVGDDVVDKCISNFKKQSCITSVSYTHLTLPTILRV